MTHRCNVKVRDNRAFGFAAVTAQQVHRVLDFGTHGQYVVCELDQDDFKAHVQPWIRTQMDEV